MLLQEEYIKRHSLDIPLIVCTSNGNAIFRHKDFRYIVVGVEWKYYSWHVGHFRVRLSYPRHNGFENSFLHDDSPCFSSYDDIAVEWSDYYAFFDNWASIWRKKCKPVPYHETLTSCWEMFLYCFDKWLVENASTEFMNIIDKTTDFSSPDRAVFVKKAMQYLGNNHDLIYRRFQNEILRFCTYNYMTWLTDLLESNVEKSIISW